MSSANQSRQLPAPLALRPSQARAGRVGRTHACTPWRLSSLVAAASSEKSTPRICSLAIWLLLGSALAAHGSFRVPPELEHATEQETARYLQFEGDTSLREKIEVGRQRYEERLAFRQALANTMRTNRERRQTIVSRQLAVAPAPRPEPSASQRYLVWLIAVGLVGVCAFLHFRIRRIAKVSVVRGRTARGR